MPPFVRECPRCGESFDAVPAARGVLYESCPRCHGAFVESADLEVVFGGRPPAPHPLALPNPFESVPIEERMLVCPTCRRPSLAAISVGELDRGIHACTECGGHFFELSAFAAVRRMVTDGEAPPRISTAGLELDERAFRTAASRAPGLGLAGSAPLPATPESPAGRARAEAIDIHGSGAHLGHEPGEPELWRQLRARLLGSPEPRDHALESSRLPHEEPYSRLFTLPIALVLGALLAASEFGRLLATPFRIQFHEMGHAIPAWLSGRIAVPLPCGMTFWSEETSGAAHVVVELLVLLLVIRGVRERRPFAIALGAAVTTLHVALGLVASTEHALACILLSGGAAEMVLPAACLVAFYFRMPDGLRWDFFRFLVAPPAAISFVGAFTLWISVVLGRTDAPIGSIVGTAGDGTGDLERLVFDHGFALVSIARGYVVVGFVALATMITVWAFFARLALVDLRARRRSAPGAVDDPT